MRTAVLWGLLALLCQQTLVSAHILGSSSSATDLTQLKSLLEQFEETLAEAAQEDYSEADDGGTNQEPEQSPTNRRWIPNHEGNQEPLMSDRAPSPAESHSGTGSQRSRLLDLLMTARKKASGCFGVRIDRIQNTSGFGCNSGRG